MSVREDWNTYLAEMIEKHGELGIALNKVWDYAKMLCAPVPVAMLLDDESAFHMAWDNGWHHLDVDVSADGSWEWFYRNRLTDELDGGDNNNRAGFEQHLKQIVGE